MAETKDSRLNSLIREYNEVAPNSKKLGATSTFVGGGVAVGTARIISGFSCEVFTTQEGAKPWLAVVFADGTKISLRSFMGIPSLEGFSKEGTVSCDEFTGNTLPNGEREVTVRTISATADIDPSKRYIPTTWCVNDFLNREINTLIGAKVTYHGTVIKEYIVRRPFGNQVPGGKAAITVDLWTVEKPSAPTE